jgi:uncharacterized protein (DUF1778 family)
MTDEKKTVLLILTAEEHLVIAEAQHKSQAKSFSGFVRDAALREANRVLNSELASETQAAGV